MQNGRANHVPENIKRPRIKKRISKEKSRERKRGERIENAGSYNKDRSGVASHRVKVARSPLEVLIKRLCDFEHTFDVYHGKRRFLVDGEGLGGAYRVLDL